MEDGYYKRNSLFMPKKHSRTWTVITNIRVERLQDITIDDIQKEGVIADTETICGFEAFDMWQDLWDSINGKPRKDGVDISWNSNCWVWAVSFERIKKDNK